MPGQEQRTISLGAASIYRKYGDTCGWYYENDSHTAIARIHSNYNKKEVGTIDFAYPALKFSASSEAVFSFNFYKDTAISYYAYINLYSHTQHTNDWNQSGWILVGSKNSNSLHTSDSFSISTAGFINARSLAFEFKVLASANPFKAYINPINLQYYVNLFEGTSEPPQG